MVIHSGVCASGVQFSDTRLLCVLQVFFGVTVYGLFHGLVLLPVLLSLIGPDPYLPVRAEIELKRPAADTNGRPDGDRQQTQTGGTDTPAASVKCSGACLEMLTNRANHARSSHICHRFPDNLNVKCCALSYS